jgi:hypothetical protein
MGEVFEESLTAEHFSDADGNPLAFGQIPVDEAEIVSETPLNEGQPDKEDFEGYTGNAGMTLERWYHRAAVMLWPEESRFDVLCEPGVEAAVGGLEQMVKQWKRAKKGERAALEQPCLEFAGRIIAHWPERAFVAYYHRENAANAPLLPLLETLVDTSLVAAWLRGVLAKDVSVDPGKALGDVCQLHGWLTFQDELRELFENTSNETIERNARLLADFALRKDKNADRRTLCAQLARQILAAVERWTPRPTQHNWQTRTVNCSELLPPLVQSFIALEEDKLLGRLAAYVLDRPKEFDLTTVQIPALIGLETWLKRNVKRPCAPLHRWLAAVHDELDCRASHPPQEPADWRRESALPCQCADCKELSRFLKDPHTEVLRLPLAEQRRRHLHQVIDGNQLDTTHVTQRRGRPYVLVCTKTKASYERALQAHRVDLDHLAKIRKLLEWHEGLRKNKA